MKKCPYCGKEIQDSATECSHCGKNLAEKKSESTIIPFILGIVAVLLALLVFGLVWNYTHKGDAKNVAKPQSEYAETSSMNNEEISDDKGPELRSDINHPSFASRETVSFPLRRNFVSSGSNFVVSGGSNTYFAYLPQEKWGVYLLTFDEGFTSVRYLYCTGFDPSTEELTLAVYNPNGSYVGEMKGVFHKTASSAYYDCVFTNTKGASADYYIEED